MPRKRTKPAGDSVAAIYLAKAISTTTCGESGQVSSGRLSAIRRRFILASDCLTADKSDDRYFADVFLERCAECVPQFLDVA